MIEIIHETVIDSLKLVPFLFVTFLVMEYFEHKMKNKNKKIIEKAGRFGPVIGSLLGTIPQCGFSVAATNFYATRIISIGTLISIYLSTSDEMIPILLSQKAPTILIIKILLIKVVIGMVAGFIIDLLIRKKEKVDIHEFCHEEHCDCEHGILKSSIKHTLDIFAFILVVNFILNIGFEYLGEDTLSKLFLKKSIFGPFIASIIGLIPNCGSSVALTELYLSNTISFASLISGLLTGSGVAILVLFKVNKDKKENIKILSIVYFIGVLVGIILHILNYFM